MSNLTKKALENSLKKMLLKKKVNKITVEDLTNDCGINRMTFYYHFHDIYELIEWVCLEDAKEAIKGKKTYDTWQEGYYQIFEAVLGNKQFIMNVYKNISREHIEKFVKELTYKLIMDVINEKSKNIKVEEEDKKFIANFYKNAFVGIMLDWIEEDMKEDPKIIVDKLNILVHGNIIEALEQFNKDNN